MAAKTLKLSTMLASLLIAGCADNLARRDTILSGSGDSKAANAAIHTIDPWPRRSQDARIGMDGIKAQQAMEKYYRPSTPQNGAGPIMMAPMSLPGAPPDGQKQN